MITYNGNAEEKLKNFTPKNTSLVADFDGTIIRGTQANSFTVFRRVLGEDYTSSTKRLFELFHPHEVNHEIDPSQKAVLMTRWWKQHFEIFTKIPLTQGHMDHEFVDDLTLRRGISELIDNLRSKSVPIIVFSAGVAQAIDRVLERDFGSEHAITVVANRLVFDSNGVALGVEGEPIHTVNKTDIHFGHLFPETIRDRTHAIIIGDSLSDADMIQSVPPSQRLTIGFLNNPDDHRRALFSKKFDITVDSWECDGGIGKILSQVI